MARKLRGLYLNQPSAKCSIFESGQMVYKALQYSDRFTLDYFELEPATAAKIPPADFYLFNYHHATMAWLDTKSLSALPGKKITVVLEMLPGNPFVYVSPDDFDAYLVLDPTMNIDNAKVYGFPRPLEESRGGSPYIEKAIPWIGTFGFSTPGKGFELVVDAVNREFEQAVVRINIPPGTFADDHAFLMHKRNYAEYLTDLCQQVAKPGIEVRVSRDFMSKEQLIEWCGQNTLNCFLYARNQPGLSATTDQCITTGRPLAVSANETFRHLHQFIRPYPEVSLKDALEHSSPAVRRMQAEWTPKNFSLRMEQVLVDLKLLDTGAETKRLFSAPIRKRETLLWVSSPGSPAELQLFARTTAKAVGRVSDFKVTEALCSQASDFRSALSTSRAERAVIVWDKDEFPWLTNEVLGSIPVECLALVHPGKNAGLDRLLKLRALYVEPTNGQTNVLPRVLPLNCNELPIQDVPTFAAPLLDSDMTRALAILELVQTQFEQANLIFYVPNAAAEQQGLVQAQIRKAGIGVSFIHEHFPQEKLLAMMGFASLTIFAKPLPAELIYLDHALATQRPIAIIPGGAADYLRGDLPGIFLDRNPLRDIMSKGIAPYIPFYNNWSEARFLHAFAKQLSRPETASIPNVPRLNRLISRSHQGEYLPALAALQKLATEILEQTLPEKIIVHAFVLDTVEHFAQKKPDARILGIETEGDPAVETLIKLGYPVEEIDSGLNFTLDQFYNMPTTVHQSYDIIFASTALDHTEDPEMFLAQVGDLLAPGGVAVLACSFAAGAPHVSPENWHSSGGFRVFDEQDFRERFLPILGGCHWADAPSWKAAGENEQGTYATLVIAKSASLS